MKNILIPASKSLTVTSKFPCRNLNNDKIKVGYDGNYIYYSYLYFDISSLPRNIILYDSKLILFKVDKFYNDKYTKFLISPLKESFNKDTTYFNLPDYYRHKKIPFRPMTSKIAISTDITPIVCQWLYDRKKNKGIILYNKRSCATASFASSRTPFNYLIPLIKINYDIYPVYKRPNSSIKKVNVTGTVAPNSTYYIIINMEVTRASNGKKDNYYIADEYNNSLNNKALHINKTYNIVISPKIKPGDIKKVSLHGSYKGPISIS